MRFLLVLLSLSACLSGARAQVAPKPHQQVIVSFDGAHDNAQWERSLELGAEVGARFTYFLSCVWLLSPDTRAAYHQPSVAPGRSNIGFAPSRDDVAVRLAHIWQASLSGHEIASHGCGHFDGGHWSKADWLHEFDAFSDIVTRAWEINAIPGEPAGWRDLAASMSGGFRAPYLSTGKTLFEALAARGFAYDASTVSDGPAAPKRRDGLVSFALPMIPEGPSSRPVIAMDYNLFARHSRAEEDAANAALYEERAYETLRAAFDRQYEGDRVPLQMGFHFTLMNGGAYWNALERLVREVCVRDDVDCISYREAVSALNRDQADAGG